MRNYQYLTLIGSILGILIAFAYISVIGSPFFFDSTQKELEEVVGERGSRAAEIQYSAAAMILYIIAIISAFVIKQKTKVVGITLLVIAVATLFLIGLFSAIGFALLLTSGIVALRYKMPSVQQD